MTEFNVISEKPITMAEVAEKLKKIEKRDKELSFRGNKTKEYLSNFVGKEKIADIKKKLEALEVSRLKERHIVKIIDIRPTDTDSLKVILSGEAITVKEEDLKKILDAING
jgi:DNA-directed RNA polymerase subunit F